MNPNESLLARLAQWLTFTSAVAVLFSIAVSQILLALALAALLLSGARLRLPPIWKPLSFFLGATLISLALSDNPSGGVPQIRKIYVFCTLLAAYSTLRNVVLIRGLFLCWAGAGSVIALRGFVQFGNKLEEARALGRNFYEYYVPERITGFMSHWMTFSGQEMFVFLMLGAFLFFSPAARKRLWIWLTCTVVIGLALLLGYTRSIIWLATPAAVLYLIWCWNRRALLAAPVAAALALAVGPAAIRERFTSMFQPRKDVDSNQHRIVSWRTGLRMIATDPWFGLGPEEVKRRFDEFVPPDVPRPLPSGWYGHLHNIYLHYAAERGLPAVIALLWLFLQALRDFQRRLKVLPPGREDRRFILHGATAVIIATMVAGLFELNLGDSEVLTMFLVVVSCGYVAVDESQKEPQAIPVAA